MTPVPLSSGAVGYQPPRLLDLGVHYLSRGSKTGIHFDFLEEVMRALNLAAVVVAFLVAGCAAQVVSSSDRTVVVKARIQDVAQAQTLASAECKKSGRVARLNGKIEMNQYVFDCVN